MCYIIFKRGNRLDVGFNLIRFIYIDRCYIYICKKNMFEVFFGKINEIECKW